MKTKYPAYIVLDIPEPFASQIIAIRSKCDSFRARIPAEITVFGSTGTRHIKEGQEISFMIKELERIIPSITRVSFTFSGLKPVPGSSGHAVFLDPNNKDAFIRIHEAIKNGTSFDYVSSEGKYSPHCSIGRVDKSSLENVRAQVIPGETIELRKLSLVQFNPETADTEYLHSWSL